MSCSMTYHSSLMAPQPLSSASIAVLRCDDPFEMNPTPLAQLFAEMPADEAEDIVCRVLEDIAARLDSLHIYRIAGGFDDILKPARRIAAVARQIGLKSVAVAAEHVACASEQKNGVAIGATSARLERAFDAAVSQVWNYQNFVKK